MTLCLRVPLCLCVCLAQCVWLFVCLRVLCGFGGCLLSRLGVDLCMWVLELCVSVSVHVSLGGGHRCGRLCGSRFVFLGPFSTCMDIYEHLGEAHGCLTVSLCGSVPAACACM